MHADASGAGCQPHYLPEENGHWQVSLKSPMESRADTAKAYAFALTAYARTFSKFPCAHCCNGCAALATWNVAPACWWGMASRWLMCRPCSKSFDRRTTPSVCHDGTAYLLPFESLSLRGVERENFLLEGFLHHNLKHPSRHSCETCSLCLLTVGARYCRVVWHVHQWAPLDFGLGIPRLGHPAPSGR